MRRDGIQSQVKRAHLTIRERPNKYLSYKNRYRYIDDFPTFVRPYNDRVQSAKGMVPSLVTDLDNREILGKMDAKRLRFHVTDVKFRVGQHVRISKLKMKFAKSAE